MISPRDCGRIYSYLGLDRAYRKIGGGSGIGVLAPGWDIDSAPIGVSCGDTFVPWSIPGCVLAACTDTSQYPGAVVFPADPCANGTFTGDVSWTKGAQWTLPGTTADKAAGGANNLTQACLTVGNTYTITYTISAVAAGTITVYAGTTAGTARNAAGTYTETLACVGNTSLGFVPSAAGTTCQIDNVLVLPLNTSQLTDLTGLGHHLVQATAAKQPLWMASGAGGLLRFNGTSHAIRAVFALNQPMHAFVATKWHYKPVQSDLCDGGTGLKCVVWNASDADNIVYGYAGIVMNGPALVTDTNAVLDFLWSGAVSKFGISGAAPTVGNTDASPPGGFTFGAPAAMTTTFAQADLYSIIVYDRALSEADRQRVVRWCRRLGARLGVVIP